LCRDKVSPEQGAVQQQTQQQHRARQDQGQLDALAAPVSGRTGL